MRRAKLCSVQLVLSCVVHLSVHVVACRDVSAVWCDPVRETPLVSQAGRILERC